MKIFLAGATGAIGKILCGLLLRAGHVVSGTTRSGVKAESLRAAGVEPIVVDVFDGKALAEAVRRVGPDLVMHQLTDLPFGLDPARMAVDGPQRNARVRIEGTQNLIDAALAAGVRRVIAQSIAWVYAPGAEPHAEEDPLELDAHGARGVTLKAVATLERLVLGSPPIDGIVLRYGRFYGPGTGLEVQGQAPVVHVDAAAWAALLAVERGRPGIYNIAEPCEYLRTEKARRELGWEPGSRRGLGREPGSHA
jgi:nucleoside-diphosphate-sugar epimerase